jgi:tetratricopeptide (TPR) repeat protein
VRYVLEGSIRRAAERVRITGQLIDATTGMHIWADRFDGVLIDIFELQDQVAASIVGAIEPNLLDAEIERARLKPAENLRAYDLVLRSRFAFRLETRNSLEEAIRLLRRAIDVDPNYPLARALLALSNFSSAVRHWTTPTEAELAEYVQLARDAVGHGSDDPEVLVPAAHVIAMAGGDFSDGFAMMDRACMLNSNSAEAWAARGLLTAYTGDIDTALNHLERSRRLSPRVSFFQYIGFTLAHFVAGSYDEAVNCTAEGLGRYPTYVPLLRYRVAALGLLGRTEEARQAVARLLALVPNLTIARIRHHVEIEMKNPYKKPGVVEAYYEGLRRAGLPE